MSNGINFADFPTLGTKKNLDPRNKADNHDKDDDKNAQDDDKIAPNDDSNRRTDRNHDKSNEVHINLRTRDQDGDNGDNCRDNDDDNNDRDNDDEVVGKSGVLPVMMRDDGELLEKVVSDERTTMTLTITYNSVATRNNTQLM